MIALGSIRQYDHTVQLNATVFKLINRNYFL